MRRSWVRSPCRPPQSFRQFTHFVFELAILGRLDCVWLTVGPPALQTTSSFFIFSRRVFAALHGLAMNKALQSLLLFVSIVWCHRASDRREYAIARCVEFLCALP